MQFAVYATDPDLDIANLLLTKYWPCNASVPYDGPHIIALSSQFAAEVMYSIIDPMLWNYAPIWFLTGYPLGAWRIEFQIEDTQGNESNIFKVYVSVHESG